MKLKNLFAVALSAAVLLSCTETVEKIVEVEKEPGYARFKVGLGLNELSGRAGHSDGTPTDDETEIYNYALFIFKSSGMLETSLISTPYKTETNSGNQPYPGHNTGLTFSKAENPNNPYLDDDGVLTLTAGTKLFFAIVNAPYELLAVQEEYLNNNSLNQQALTSETLEFEDLSTIVGSYTDGDGIVSFTNGNNNNRGFMMTTIDSKGYEEKYLEETGENDAPQAITLKVGRAMAKVSLGTELPTTPDPDISPNGVLDVHSYKIINNPKEMFIMPHTSSNVPITPYYYDNTVRSTYFESHNTVISSDPLLETNYMPVSEDGAKTFTYCIENSNLSPKQGNSTIAVVKGKYTPDSNIGSAIIHDNPIDKNPTTIATDSPDGTFYRIWIPLYEENSEAKGNRYDGIYYTDAITDQQLADYTTALSLPNGVELKLDKYPQGYCYYRLPLYNGGNEYAPYTVKRNSYYKIDIVEVIDAGYTDEDKGGGGEPVDPEEPLEPQSEITVKIVVEDWEEINQGGAL